MKKRFTNYSLYFDKNDRMRKGIITESFNTNPEFDDPAKNDRDNRREVVERIKEIIDNGKSIEEAVTEIYSTEDIRNSFKYLEKAGIDLKKAFKSWYEGYIKRINDERNIAVIGSNKKRKLEER